MKQSPVGIICGEGDYPRLVAIACVEKGLDFCLVFLNGFCDKNSWPEVASISVNLGEVGRTIDFFKKNRVKKIVFAGRVKRPNFRQLSVDRKGKSWLLKLKKSIFAGDDGLLKAVAKLVQNEGFEIISGTSLLDDIFFTEGVFSLRTPSAADQDSITLGLSAARELGLSDLGQSVIVYNKKILGKEDENGTNALIEKCGLKSKKGGILIKISKPQQDIRLDLPTIGVETIEMLHKNHFDGVVVEAGKCIVLNKEEIIKRADELNIFITAIQVKTTKFFIIAGEASGDYLGSKLMRDIVEISNKRIEFFGIGGQYMEKAGLKKLFAVHELSIIGIWEVIRKILHVRRLINETVKVICDYRPDVIVTIDSSGFTHRVAKKIKNSAIGNKIPIVHYVAPPVWAWRPWRAKAMHKFIDILMVLFPFEPQYFRKHGLKTVFVGHPIVSDPDFNKPHSSKLQNFLHSVCKNNEEKKPRIITLLPGSRISEIIMHLPILEKFTQLMVDKYKNVKFVIPTIEHLKSDIEIKTKHWRHRPIIITQTSQKVLSYYLSHMAVASSGTVALELARVGLPFVVIYKTSLITYFIVRLLIRIKNICLVNLLAGENVIPELLQKRCTAENIFHCAERILDGGESKKQKQTFSKIIKTLHKSPNTAAEEVLNTIQR
ncbi:MAG: lipid-A-disaccharide synthase [Holosporaceae bacterium]|jgi:lipid-A-disaccharide synthase|nr:lipid-A-disaccharide synthase [Holosporaceae bacterium]